MSDHDLPTRTHFRLSEVRFLTAVVYLLSWIFCDTEKGNFFLKARQGKVKSKMTNESFTSYVCKRIRSFCIRLWFGEANFHYKMVFCFREWRWSTFGKNKAPDAANSHRITWKKLWTGEQPLNVTRNRVRELEIKTGFSCEPTVL